MDETNTTLADNEVRELTDPFIGKVLTGRYRVDKLIGSGGWGNVYLGTHLSLDSPIAIKVLHQHFSRDQERQRRLEQEAKILSRVDSQYVVKTLDYGLTPIAFIAMEYFDGIPLSDMLEQDGALKQDEAVTLFEQLCEGLKAAHSVGLIHRDLKPSNILVKRGEQGELRCKILDFGVAKILNDTGSGQKLTATGEILGSPPYMSPEQWTARPMDSRSDIYSLGCLMYEALSKKQMFRAENGFEYLNLHLSVEPETLSQNVQSLNPNLAKLIHKCVQKAPDDRYADVDALLADLRKIRSGKNLTINLKPTVKSTALAKSSKPKWPLYLLAAATTVAIGGVIAFHQDILISLCSSINQEADRDSKLGKAEKAISEYKNSLALAQYLPVQNKNRLHAMRALSTVLQKNGSFAEASKLTELIKKDIGENQPSDWVALYQRAVQEKSAGRFGRAETYAKGAMKRAEQYGGKHTLIYALSLDLLGSVYQMSGRGVQGVAPQQQALQICEDLLEPDDPQIPLRLNNLGLCLRQQNNYEDAKKAYQRAIEIAIKNEHPELAVRPYNNTGTVLIKQKQYDKALASCMRALELDKQTGDTAGSSIMDHIGAIHFLKNEFPESIKSFREALEYRKKDGTINLPEAIESYENMAQVYLKIGQPDKAAECYKPCIAILKANNPASTDISRFTTLLANAEKLSKDPKPSPGQPAVSP